MTPTSSRSNAATLVLPVATAVVAIAIFIADTVTDVDIAYAVLYVVVVLMAARFLSAQGVMLVAAGCLGLTVVSYLLTATTGRPFEGIVNTLISLGAILLTAVLAVQAQKATEALQKQASLLNETHNSIFVRDMNDMITYWNRGAQERYGWRAEEAIGKSSRELCGPFSQPRLTIRLELLRAGRWEGELKHYRADGAEVIAASRWALQRDAREQPTAILETNNDITERKRREEDIERLNRELAKRAEGLDQQLAKRATELEATNKEFRVVRLFSVARSARAASPYSWLRGVAAEASIFLVGRQGSPVRAD